MKFSHIAIGGGITGIETTIKIIQEFYRNYKNNKFAKKLSIAIVDRSPDNIPGGVAYGLRISKYGYFNNPIRLSPKIFQDWIFDKKNKKKIIDYLKKNGGSTGHKWIKKNKKILFSLDKKKLSELYIPRAISNRWMEEKLIKLLNEIKKKIYLVRLIFFMVK